MAMNKSGFIKHPRETVESSPDLVPPPVHETRPNPTKVGMLCFLASEIAFFGTLIMTFLFYLNQIAHGDPRPSQVFEMGLVLLGTLCLVSSSFTIHLAERSLEKGNRGSFLLWWGFTILLGALFLLGTAYEWYGLIYRHGLTISRNLFGSAYFTLVGFHAAHVTIGLILLVVIYLLVLKRKIADQGSDKGFDGVTVVSWYWHFVDAVWIIVFTLVYVVARGMA